MGLLAMLLLGCAVVQEPSAELQRALTLDSSATRFRAAVTLAESGVDAERWLLKEVGQGSSERQRALLLACALMGTERTLAEVEKAARRGTRAKPDPLRAYALLLYGAHHPAAGAVPKEDWRRARTDYERACLMLGLLGRRGVLADPAWEALVAEGKREELQAIHEMGLLLAGEAAPPAGPKAHAARLGARLLASVLHDAAPAPDEAIAAAAGKVPELWRAAARRAEPRDADALRAMPAASTGAAAGPAMRELASADDQQAVFEHFHARVRDPVTRAWLFGAAGDLGLAFPEPLDPETLDVGEVAGILRLARTRPDRAGEAARQRAPAARLLLEKDARPEERWPASLVLALGVSLGAAGASDEERKDDLEVLRALVEDADGAAKIRLWPVWNLARGALADAGNRDHWFRVWARGLHAGVEGFLDVEGPRWASFLLVGGTQAAEERLHLVERHPALEFGAHDYAPDHNLYRDLADYLAGSYRFGLPD